MDRGGGSVRGSSSSHQFSDNPSHRTKTLGNRTGQTLGPWQKTVPALLKTSGDLGASFIDYQRRNRMNYGSGRARSEVGELLSNGSNRMNTSFNYGDRSFNDDMRIGNHRSSSVYERPKSSYLPTAPPPAQRLVMRPRDDWMEVRRQQQFSSEDDFDEEDVISEDEELAMYNSQRNYDRSHQDFDESDIFVFGVIQLSLSRARQIVRNNPPPPQFWNLKAEEKTAYLYYYTLYKHYITPVKKFYNIFNREFFRYTAEGCSETEALVKICRHTKDEYDARRQRANKMAYDRSRRHLFSDDRATPDSRASDRPSYCEPLDESDLGSIDSSVKEPLKFSRPHAFVSFGPGGKLLIMDPEYSICSLKFENVKSRIKDRAIGRNIAELEAFKGPYIVGETPSHLPLLYIERQIGKILNSEIYRQNPESSDANDVLLIWRLLEILVRQHGNITGPDLARLLTTNYSYSSTKPLRGRADKEVSGNRTDSPYYSIKDERKIDPRATEKFTQYLIGGYIEEAIESAMSDGLLFDALILAYKMFGNNPKKLEEIELKLLSFRSPQQPALTLLSVASQMPVPILNNMSSVDDASGWRAHIAIVLANLNTPSAMQTVHELGLALSRREFNAAADFCFLAVNLLTNYDCFVSPIQGPRDGEDQFRNHITLINASLPDDTYYSTQTSYGWSVTDFQATEIYEYSLQLSQRQIVGGLRHSNEYQKCKLQYAQLLAEYGGFGAAVFKYCSAVAGCIWDRPHEIGSICLKELCDLAESHYWYTDLTKNDIQWISTLKNVAAQLSLVNSNNQLNDSITQNQENSIPDGQMLIPPVGTSGFETSTPVGKEEQIQQQSVQILQHVQEVSQSVQSFVPVVTQQQNSGENYQIPVVDNQQYVSNRQMSSSPTNSVISNTTLPTVHDEHNYGMRQGTFSPRQSFDYGGNEKRERIDSVSYGYAPSIEGGGGRLSRQRTISQNSVNTPLGSPKSSFTPINNFDFPPPSIPEKSTVSHHSPIIQNQTQQQKFVPEQFQPIQQQQQKSQDVSQNQKELSPDSQKKQEQKSGGLFSGLAGKLVKMIPASNQMILPDDTNPTIRWDPNLNKYVGEGVEEIQAPPPPPPGPTMPSVPTGQSVSGSSVGTRSGPRRPGARYANPFANSTTAVATSSATPESMGGMLPPVGTVAPPLPPSFGFIPAPTQDDEGINPFSDNPVSDGSQQQ